MAFVEGFLYTNNCSVETWVSEFCRSISWLAFLQGWSLGGYAWVPPQRAIYSRCILAYLFPCRVCVPKSAEKKHHYIAHEPLKCECGTQTTQVRSNTGYYSTYFVCVCVCVCVFQFSSHNSMHTVHVLVNYIAQSV